MKKNKILLTGGSGFLGKTIIEKFASSYEILAPNHNELDLLDSIEVLKYLEKNSVDLIIHAAAVGTSREKKQKIDIVSQNLRMFFNLVRSQKMYNRMIFFGSGAEYGKQRNIHDVKEEEFDEFVPHDEYGFSKYICAKYAETVNFITHLRLFAIYGKYEDYSTRFISNIICKALYNQPIIMYQNVYFDYLYINDFVQILEHLIQRKMEHTFYNIGRGQKIDLLTIAKRILYLMGKDALPIVIEKPGLNYEYTCNIGRLLLEFQSISYMDFDQSLIELIEYYTSIKHTLHI